MGAASISRHRRDRSSTAARPRCAVNNMYSADQRFRLMASLSTARAAGLRAAERLRRAAHEERGARNRVLRRRRSSCRSTRSGRRGRRCGRARRCELTVCWPGENGAEVPRKVAYQVPTGRAARAALLHGGRRHDHEHHRVPAGDRRPCRGRPRRCISLLNGLRANTKAYVRVWRAGPGFQVQGEDLPAPPPSVAMILAARNGRRRQPARRAIPRSRSWKSRAGDVVVTGSKTVQVEVKE